MNANPHLEQVMGDIGQLETLSQALVLFQTVGMPARNLAANTRTWYTKDIAAFITFLEARGVTKLAQVGLPELEAYLAELDRHGYEASSRQRKTFAVKSLFHFLHRQGIVPRNPADRLIAPTPKKREPRFLSEEEYQRLLRVCSHNARDAAIIEVLLQTGMRLSELVRLTLTDVELPKRISRDPDNTGTVRILRKGGKTDTIPLNYKACQAIAGYLKVRPSVLHERIFLTKFKEPISARAVQYVVAHYLKEAGIPRASVHTLRHTMATHHVARGTDLKTVQETLGHASLDTTAIYVSLAKKTQKKALQEHAL